VALLEGRDGWRALAIGAQTSAIGCKLRAVCACTLKQIGCVLRFAFCVAPEAGRI
jgi:hypothetical protein